MPPTKPISPFVKLYLPFDNITWLLLIGLFLIATFLLLIKRKILKFYQRLFGAKVKNLIFNMVTALTGGNQKKLPYENIPRFLLAIFLIFCLIMRTAYQGKLFEIMQKEIHEKELDTIDELIEENFVFHTYESLVDRVKWLKFAER
jgi:hypothetical protein